MRRKTYLIIIFSLIGIILIYLLYFFISTAISDNKFEINSGKSNFDITTILNLSKKRITAESEVYKNEEFIEYDCVIDESFCIMIIKVGKLEKEDFFPKIKFIETDIPSRQNWFNYDISTPHPISNIPMKYVPWYNVSLLPLDNIKSIEIFIDGIKSEREDLDKNTFFYTLNASKTSISFNDKNKTDLFFQYASMDQPSSSNIFFSKDDNNFLYIGYVSSINKPSKTLEQIIRSE